MVDYVPDVAVDRPDHPDPDDAPADPLALAAEWLPGNDDPVRPVLTLGTVDADGWPDARSVLLSRYDAQGLHFHTDALSRKVAHLRADPRAVATFLWPEVLRQLVMQGVVEVSDADGAQAAYMRRARYLQLLAWVNTADHASLPVTERVAAWARFDGEHPDGTLTAPDTWIGYVLRPTRMSFWQGRPDRASIRVEYRSTPQGWVSTRLPG